MSYSYVDLFCGAGGLSLGFDNAGFQNALAIEFNSKFAETYKRNFPSHNLYIEDIKEISNDRIFDLMQKECVDVVIGGPPCQGFSLAGNIGRTFIDDERNELFKEFVRFVSVIKPKIFVMENVAAMATHLKGETIKLIINEFKKVKPGYIVEWKVLNTVNYGIAQERRRIVIVGVRSDVKSKFEYPEKTDKVVTIKEVIDDLPKLESGEFSIIPNHNAMQHSEQMLHKMKFVKDGGDRMDIPEDIRPKSGDARKYIRYNSNKPSVCITGDMRKAFHYSQNRALTNRELARIQSFPDSFIFEGNSIDVQQQIGNAVPPKLAELIARQVKKVLDNE